jgi:putative transcription factor
MECEVCGSDNPDLRKTDFGGANLMACPNCREKETEKPLEQEERKPFIKGKKLSNGLDRKELTRIDLIQGWGQKIRKAREQKGLTLKELGEKIFEKESIMQKFESQKLKPSKKVIEKLESFLEIQLIEDLEDNPLIEERKTEEETGSFTLGDFVKRKK